MKATNRQFTIGQIMMCKRTTAILVFAALAIPATAAEPPPASHRVLTQMGAPVLITEYGARYQPRSRYQSEGIRHELSYRNASEKKIVALQFGLLAFNIFNEFQDRLSGFTIEDVAVGETESGVWVASALAEAAFYTGVAYVDKVRFEDGVIWSADDDEILSQLREIETDLDAEALGGVRLVQADPRAYCEVGGGPVPDTLTIRLTLEQVELLERPVRGQGGFQSFLDLLQSRRQGNLITLTRSDCEKVVRYCDDYGQGGFQERLCSIAEAAQAHLRRVAHTRPRPSSTHGS